MKKLTMVCAALLCLAVGPVFAATITCTGSMSGLISGQLVVPTGEVCNLYGAEVTGPVTVKGSLNSFGTRFDAGINVTGGVINIANGNGEGSAINGGLTITQSPGNNSIGCPNFSNVIHGQLSFTNSSGNLYVCQVTVGGSVTVNGNVRVNNDWSGMYVADLNNVTATKLACDANVSANGSPAIKGGNITAQTSGQCVGL